MSTKTWQEKFEEEFLGKFCSTKTINEIKQFLSRAIDQTREETIREVEKILPKRIDDNSEHYNDCLEEIKQSLINLRK